MAELLLGAGRRHHKVFGGEWKSLTTLDINPQVQPDVVWDLNRLPLPFDAGTFDEIHAVDVLEHTGTQGDWRFFFRQWDEFWRILKNGGTFNCCAPRRESPWAWGDPGHTRIIMPEQLSYLHRPNYDQVGASPMTDYRAVFRSDWDPVRLDVQEHHNLFSLKAVKPAR